MQITSGLVVSNPAVATVYYAVRHLDTGRKGWVCVPIERLCRLLKISIPTLRRRLKEGREAGWFQTVDWHKPTVFIKLTGQTRLIYQLDVRKTVVHIPCALAFNKNSIRARALLGGALGEQRVIQNKVCWKQVIGEVMHEVFDQRDAKRVWRQVRSQLNPNGCELPSTVHHRLGRKQAFIALTLDTLAERLGVNRWILQKALRSAPKVRLQQYTTYDEDEIERGQTFLDRVIINNKRQCAVVRNRPCVYIDTGVLDCRYWRDTLKRRQLINLEERRRYGSE